MIYKKQSIFGVGYCQAAGVNHIAFKVNSDQEVQAFAAELKSQPVNIALLKPDSLCFEDSNNFAVEIVSY